MASFPELSAPLAGAVARLRIAAERDIPEVLIAHQDDPSMYVRLGLARPPSGAELGRRVDGGADDRATGAATWLTIVLDDSDECRGQIDVHAVDWDHRRAELGIWVAPGSRGRGAGADALALVGAWLLGECGLERVQLLTEPDNAALQGAARRAGYREEGLLRAYLRERQGRADMVVLSLIRADLEPSR